MAHGLLSTPPHPLYLSSQVLLALLTPDPSHARGLVHARVRRRLAVSLRELCDPALLEQGGSRDASSACCATDPALLCSGLCYQVRARLA
jgi:hypothetical protein